MEVDGPTILLGPLERADGSARFENGGMAVMAAVYGPAPVKTKQELIETATVVVNLESFTMPPSLVQNSLALRVQSLLEQVIVGILHPRSLITIAVQPIIVTDRPFSTVFNACVLALIDAGIPLSSMPVAVEEDGLEAVFAFTSESITLLHQSLSGQEFTTDELSKRLSVVQEQAKRIFEAIQGSVQANYSLFMNS
jgi:ribonuclease PH